MKESKRGAPTKYKPEYVEEARKFCLLKGATDADLASHFEVAESTIKEWYKKHPEFSASVKAGKVGADMNVAEGFFKRATGIEFTEVTRELIGAELTVTKEVTKLIPPDAGAALNWLKNRQPDDWRDKVEVAHSGKIETNDLSSLTDEQLNQLLTDLQTKVSHAADQS
ncbi:terminase [Spirosoma aerolatum]|uniref:terminase n=1 Tax=Spirosoma aerolatum TaxID=1211326 RepID=UPI0009AC73FB|nr:terminase [Spirosoma aerolatum]